MAIISVLAGLLLPALETAVEQARRAACMSNLKQMHLGLIAYRDDSEAYPHSIAGTNGAPRDDQFEAGLNWWNTSNPSESGGNGWFYLTRGSGYDYVTMTVATGCPSSNVDWTAWSTNLTYLDYSYRFNFQQVWLDAKDEESAPRKEPLQPSATALLGDAVVRRAESYLYPCYNTEGDWKWSHAEGGQIAAFDGHVSWKFNYWSTTPPPPVDGKTFSWHWSQFPSALQRGPWGRMDWLLR